MAKMPAFLSGSSLIKRENYWPIPKCGPMGAAPAGTKYDMTVVHVSKFKDGKATDHWEYMTMGDMMKMMPPPPPNK